MDTGVSKRKGRFVAASLVAVVAMAWIVPGAAAGGGVEVSTDQARYVEGERIIVSVANDSSSRVRLEDPIEIVASGSDETVATYSWSGSHTLRPGQRLVWNWDHWRGECVDDCAHPDIDPPDLVGPGRYIAKVTTDKGTLESAFSIGQYFTLGFRDSSSRFGIFSFDADTVEQLKTEAEAEEKSLIVSGVVSRVRAPHNPWSFSVRPRSIVTGEVFAEVCDATPAHVARHLDEWAGQRWCPWSSYVLSVGAP